MEQLQQRARAAWGRAVTGATRHARITSPRQRAGSYLALAFVVAFGLFTGLVPCKYSSRRVVLHALGLSAIVHAQDESEWPPCDCSSIGYLSLNYCPYLGACRMTHFGCGWFWSQPCDGLTYNWYPI